MSYADFERGVFAPPIHSSVKQHSSMQQAQHEYELLNLWKESEARLSILRSLGNAPTGELWGEQMNQWIAHVRKQHQ